MQPAPRPHRRRRQASAAPCAPTESHNRQVSSGQPLSAVSNVPAHAPRPHGGKRCRPSHVGERERFLQRRRSATRPRVHSRTTTPPMLLACTVRYCVQAAAWLQRQAEAGRQQEG
jgi:hypothetical protein